MKLSEIITKQEDEWRRQAHNKLTELMDLLCIKLNKDLYKEYKIDNGIDLYSYLRGFLLANYKDVFYAAMEEVGLDYKEFEYEMIYSLILAIVRNSKSIDFNLEVLIRTNIIKDVYTEDDLYIIDTVDYGEILFKKASDVFDDKLFNKDNLNDGCHEYSLEFLNNHREAIAVTGYCKKWLCLNYHHSFIEIEDEIVDVSNNVLIDKDNFLLLNGFVEFNRVSYQEYINTKDESKEYDESGTLFDLLRMGFYNREIKEGIGNGKSN